MRVWIMRKSELVQFLDTGWYNEATLYFESHIYWCEAEYDKSTKQICFFINCWTASNENNIFYHSIIWDSGDYDGKLIYKEVGTDLDLIKNHFLSAKIFNGKTFWEVEPELLWLEDGGDISHNSLNLA